jgi:hypothetical protein
MGGIMILEMKLHLNQPASINLFIHDKDGKKFIIEASDFGPNFNIFQRIYDDAVDVGFTVVNPDTDHVILLILAREMVSVMEMSTEIDGWEFEPSFDDVRKNPRLEGYKFLVFND